MRKTSSFQFEILTNPLLTESNLIFIFALIARFCLSLLGFFRFKLFDNSL